MATRLLRVAPNFFKYSKSHTHSNLQRLLSTRAVTYEQALQNIPETQVTALKSGLKVASEESGLTTCTVGLWIDAGSRYEDDTNNGAANFVEHLAFKGTAKRSQADLEKEVENLGAHLNAYTTREQTAFFAKCLSKDVPKVVEILGDVVQNTKFVDAEIERARGAIMREMQEAETEVQEVVFDHLHSVAYQGTPLSNTILGPSDNVARISNKELTEYVNNSFKAPRMVLAGSGGVTHNQLVDLANQHLSKLGHAYDGAVPMNAPCRFTGSEVRVRDDDMPLLHFAMAVEGAGWGNVDEHVALMVASTIVGSWDWSHGGGTNSPSFLAEACATLKCAHSFQSFNTAYKDTGLWGIYFVGDPMSSDDFLFNLQNEWMRLCTQVTESQVERGRNQLRTNLMLQLEGTTAICDDIGRQVLYNGNRISPAELDSRIQDVTAGVVKQVCMKYIYDRCPAIAAVGPVEALPDYTRIRGNMAWLRF